MESSVGYFSLVEVDRKAETGGSYYSLHFQRKSLGIEDLYEKIACQYFLSDVGLYLVVLENAPYEGVGYKFYLLGKNQEVVDCMYLHYDDEEEFSFMENARLTKDSFLFKKDGKKYKLTIDSAGRVGYRVGELKYRSLADFIKPRKFLSLSMQ
ncbi:hypothetical protein ABGV49_19700 [Chromobacterium vaccinii]|uniref:Uncharacterized protein n=1 Tax=Chromobacterium vaccinii TaxID=1108595 RepID=A0ABV0FJ97_9NEIS